MRENDYIRGWEARPEEEIRALTAKGVVPMMKDMEDEREDVDMPFLMGQVAGVIGEIKPAGEIVEEMVAGAVAMLRRGQGYVGSKSVL